MRERERKRERQKEKGPRSKKIELVGSERKTK